MILIVAMRIRKIIYEVFYYFVGNILYTNGGVMQIYICNLHYIMA